ncbi:predicted protein [Nematostella vectensis]|uniref:Heparanase n=1 Tax=Nematostella vectensis TaxID=45351 RepID=A7S0R9_NEMVE|nr:predicted protein [Nematostella vectensis]|eukprot:XP_001634849.1 predicted protein [Nematostella vectensis]
MHFFNLLVLCLIPVSTSLRLGTRFTDHEVVIDMGQKVGTVSKSYLSSAFTIGTIQEHWRHFNFSSERPFTLLQGLSPMYVRFGGTASCWMHFKKDKALEHKNFTDFTITPDDLERIAMIGNKGGVDVLFGLNACLRNSDGTWNYTNPLEILKHIASQGYDFGWELGNEPNHLSKFNRSIPAVNLAHDFITLRKILDKNPDYGHILVGPDVTRPINKINTPSQQYLESFLSVARGSVDAVTWHQYYFDKRTCEVKNFYDPKILDYLLIQLHLIKDLLAEYAPDKRPWMGETDSAWGGGAEGMSDRYVAGFTWLDKLGMAARLGTEVVIRQSFFHGHYALINDDLYPNPDYWLSLLHKRLVGQEVLNVQNSLDEGRVVRVYAHCTNTGLGQYQVGSITVMAINLNTHDTVILRLTVELSGLPVDQYLLTPGDKDITSGNVKLNGEVLEMIDDVTFPNLKPLSIPTGEITLPPLTFGFWVVPDAKAAACM